MRFLDSGEVEECEPFLIDPQYSVTSAAYNLDTLLILKSYPLDGSSGLSTYHFIQLPGLQAPVEVASYTPHQGGIHTYSGVIAQDRLMIRSRTMLEPDELTVVDYTDPTDPQVTFNDELDPLQSSTKLLPVDDQLLFLYRFGYRQYDISNPDQPEYVDDMTHTGDPTNWYTYWDGILYTSSLSGADGNLMRTDFSNLSHPVAAGIAQYELGDVEFASFAGAFQDKMVLFTYGTNSTKLKIYQLQNEDELPFLGEVELDVRETGIRQLYYLPGRLILVTSSEVYAFSVTETSVNEPSTTPQSFTLGEAYPNPFNPSTVIPFELKQAGVVRVSVYDMLGRQVATLVDHSMTAGSHRAVWDGTSSSGGTPASGTYFVCLEANGVSAMRKITLLK